MVLLITEKNQLIVNLSLHYLTCWSKKDVQLQKSGRVTDLKRCSAEITKIAECMHGNRSAFSAAFGIAVFTLQQLQPV